MDILKDIIDIQNKELLKRIADDYFDEKDKEKFIKKYDKQLLKYIPIDKRNNIATFKGQLNSKYLR